MALKIEDAIPASKKSKKSKKNKKTKKGLALTRLHFILDESGSMDSCRQSTIDGFNEYLNGLRKDTNKYLVSLTKFEGGNIENVFNDIKLPKVRAITSDDFVPAGMTNLNDAIGGTLKSMEVNKPRTPHNTLVVIMTDGHENASREWTRDAVADLIKIKEKDGWTVTFLGANIDTQAVSSGYAISIDNARSYSTKGMRGTMRNLSEATTLYAQSATIGCASMDMFSAENTGLSDADWLAEDDDNEYGEQGIGGTVDYVPEITPDVIIDGAERKKYHDSLTQYHTIINDIDEEEDSNNG